VLYARQWADSLADAEDIVQMAFVRWWRHNPSADRSHVPLLYAAVRTLAMDVRRRESRRLVRESDSDLALSHEDAPHFDLPVENRETAHLLERAVQGLPQEQREVVTLRIWGGLTFAEIASATQASINTVAGRYRYALQTLQRALEPMRADLTDTAPALA
jgi:RNA polymerase sigma-70 factor (ECF subfamily)